jgi:secreted trypsin-like serine protease
MKIFSILLVLTIASVKCHNGFNIFNGLMATNSNPALSTTLNAKPCNTNSKQGDARIVGGETSPINYPYQVSLQMQKNGGGPGFFFFQQPKSNYSHFCGGSVLNENYIVTAAHW